MKRLKRWIMSFYVQWVPTWMKFRVKELQCRIWPRPMMSKPEISFFTSLLSVGSIERVVEFGAGGSTLYFPRFLPESGTWSSVEFNSSWFQLIQKHVKSNVRMYLTKDVSSVEVGFMDDLAKADLVLVDGGENRSEILDMVRTVNPSALVLLHDSWRSSYHEATCQFDRVIKVSRPYGAGPNGPEAAGGMTLLIQDSHRGLVDQHTGEEEEQSAPALRG
jgi:precorrin-6B methylase 2